MILTPATLEMPTEIILNLVSVSSVVLLLADI